MGGRPTPADGSTQNDWQNLNGTVDPNTAAVTHRTGPAHHPVHQHRQRPDAARPESGAARRTTARSASRPPAASWFDVESGDGGQVLVDPTDANFVYGNYFGISPYRNTDGGASFFSNSFITDGINLADRSEFYVP